MADPSRLLIFIYVGGVHEGRLVPPMTLPGEIPRLILQSSIRCSSKTKSERTPRRSARSVNGSVSVTSEPMASAEGVKSVKRPQELSVGATSSSSGSLVSSR